MDSPDSREKRVITDFAGMTSSQTIDIEEGLDLVGPMPKENEHLRRIDDAQQDAFLMNMFAVTHGDGGPLLPDDNHQHAPAHHTEHQRISHSADLETGRSAGARGHLVQIRNESSCEESFMRKLHVPHGFQSRLARTHKRTYSAENHIVDSGHAGVQVSNGLQSRFANKRTHKRTYSAENYLVDTGNSKAQAGNGLHSRFANKRVHKRTYSGENHSVLSGHSGLHVSFHEIDLAPSHDTTSDLYQRKNSGHSHESIKDDTGTDRHYDHARTHPRGIDSRFTQYRLEAVKTRKKLSIFRRFLCCFSESGSIYEEHNTGRSANRFVIQYLYWAFRNSFFHVFLSAALGFFLWTIFFALVLWVLGLNHPSCINGVDFGTDYFIDAFALSWTTFSTVGYGLIHSGISSIEPNIHNCAPVTFVVTSEAFVGVLFFSLCGAIIYAKVSRIQSVAQIEFSDPILIRYASGVNEHEPVYKKKDDVMETVPTAPTRLPHPILEFRMVNKLCARPGGEIINANIKAVACVDAQQEPPPMEKVLKAAKRRNSRRDIRRFGRSISMDSNESVEYAVIQTNASQPYEEDPTGHLLTKRVFSNLELECSENPFFNRVWIIRHKIDSNSPLLKKTAREIILANGGYWPTELCTAESVRSAIAFDQILVSFHGTSDADAHGVFKNKVYGFDSVNIGYKFVNMLFRDGDDESLRVDQALLNDVTEQYGGGGEPLDQYKGSTKKDIVAL